LALRCEVIDLPSAHGQTAARSLYARVWCDTHWQDSPTERYSASRSAEQNPTTHLEHVETILMCRGTRQKHPMFALEPTAPDTLRIGVERLDGGHPMALSGSHGHQFLVLTYFERGRRPGRPGATPLRQPRTPGLHRRDGTPRVVPIWFHWDGETIVLGSPPAAPKVYVLPTNSKVALAIDHHEWPYHALLVWATAGVETVEEVLPPRTRRAHGGTSARNRGANGRGGTPDVAPDGPYYRSAGMGECPGLRDTPPKHHRGRNVGPVIGHRVA
jgi:hypothetical protein